MCRQSDVPETKDNARVTSEVYEVGNGRRRYGQLGAQVGVPLPLFSALLVDVPDTTALSVSQLPLAA